MQPTNQKTIGYAPVDEENPTWCKELGMGKYSDKIKESKCGYMDLGPRQDDCCVWHPCWSRTIAATWENERDAFVNGDLIEGAGYGCCLRILHIPAWIFDVIHTAAVPGICIGGALAACSCFCLSVMAKNSKHCYSNTEAQQKVVETSKKINRLGCEICYTSMSVGTGLVLTALKSLVTLPCSIIAPEIPSLLGMNEVNVCLNQFINCKAEAPCIPEIEEEVKKPVDKE